MISIPDVNVLLALAWPNHQFHRSAHRWFASPRRQDWTTCALTELGFVRLSSNPAFTTASVTPREAQALLRRMCLQPGHRHTDCPSLESLADLPAVMGHQQVNDAYLLALAGRWDGVLVTYDRRLEVLADPAHLLVLQP